MSRHYSRWYSQITSLRFFQEREIPLFLSHHHSHLHPHHHLLSPCVHKTMRQRDLNSPTKGPSGWSDASLWLVTVPTMKKVPAAEKPYIMPTAWQLQSQLSLQSEVLAFQLSPSVCGELHQCRHQPSQWRVQSDCGSEAHNRLRSQYFSYFPFVEKPCGIIFDNFALYFTKGGKNILYCNVCLKVKENTKSWTITSHD